MAKISLKFLCSSTMLIKTIIIMFTITISLVNGRCTSEQMAQISQCAVDAQYDWDIIDTDIDSSTRKFCCFKWDTLNCQVNIAEDCDPTMAKQLAFETEQTYGATCEYFYRHSPLCFIRWWSAILIVLALILIIALIVFIVYRKKQSKFSREYNTAERNYY
ncbi:hypothetical protein DERP_006977 [Dermatophagoides pteronyssinus]|uniref:Uncharacterized protein n=1 Tax=Dermatophagoides pteronyssinus TaxID=6956 RepID=A0ABQ8JU06_DERPT|nr:hypothetical protein DERP_006977 [Dermatophagoides pteronyssinus]